MRNLDSLLEEFKKHKFFKQVNSIRDIYLYHEFLKDKLEKDKTLAIEEIVKICEENNLSIKQDKEKGEFIIY